MASFSCDPADGGGVIAVNPGGVATPAFCAKYNQVRWCVGGERERARSPSPTRVFLEIGAPPSVSPLARPAPLPHTPPLSAFPPSPQRYCDCRLLALADEEGCLSVVETGGAPLPGALYSEAGGPPGSSAAASASAFGPAAPRPRAQWLCHNNAVFDLAWARVRGWGEREGERREGAGSGERGPTSPPFPLLTLSPSLPPSLPLHRTTPAS